MAQIRYPVAPDDNPQVIVKRDLSGGMNTRQSSQILGDTQSALLQNAEITVLGERSLRTGATLIQDLGDVAGAGLHGIEPTGGTNYLIANSGAFFKWYNGSGSFASIASLASTFNYALPCTMTNALESDVGDVTIIQNGTDNAVRLDPYTPEFKELGDTNYSPPKTTVTSYYRDRLWTYENNKLSYSTAVPRDYTGISTASIAAVSFVRDTNYYNIPAGTEKALMGTREYGMLVFGSSSVWAVNPSQVPDPSTDIPDMILPYGCVEGKTCRQVNEDFFFLSHDGIRGLFRTLQDKLQAKESKPISFNLKTEFEEINWAYISKADAIYFDNRYMVSLPTLSSTYNNKLWVYYPAYSAWVVITGLNIGRFATAKFSGEEKLYGIDAVDSKVYRLFNGTSDNGTAIIYQEESKSEDFGKPLQNKSGGEVKIKVRGQNATVNAYANVDGTGYVAMNGTPITLPSGGLSFNFDFPFNFGTSSDVTGVWHLDNLGEFKTIQVKIYCNTLNAQFKILESVITTFLDEYQSEG